MHIKTEMGVRQIFKNEYEPKQMFIYSRWSKLSFFSLYMNIIHLTSPETYLLSRYFKIKIMFDILERSKKKSINGGKKMCLSGF